jgi:hypothetical protein
LGLGATLHLTQLVVPAQVQLFLQLHPAVVVVVDSLVLTLLRVVLAVAVELLEGVPVLTVLLEQSIKVLLAATAQRTTTPHLHPAVVVVVQVP